MSARIVLDVQQHDAARKLIVIRSALTMVNLLDCPVDLKMENADEKGVWFACCLHCSVIDYGMVGCRSASCLLFV